MSDYAMIYTGDLVTDLFGLVGKLLVPKFHDFYDSYKMISERNKHNNKIMKDVAGFNIMISDNMYDEIFEISNSIAFIELDLISKAINTNKWINYAIWYMTNDDAVLLKANKSARELVNAISNLAGFGSIYQDSGVVDLFEYDIKNKVRNKNSRFLLLIDDIKKALSDENFIKAKNLRKSKMEVTAARLSTNPLYSGDNYVSQDGMIHPIFFSNTVTENTVGEKQGIGISEEVFLKLENTFNGLIKDTNYSYSRNKNDMIDLVIQRDNAYGATENFLLDDGTIMGGSKISILGSFTRGDGIKDTVFVDVNKHKDIAFNILNHSFYQMTIEEVNTALADMLNPPIYNFVDFNYTPWFDYMNDIEKFTLNSNLTTIMEFLDSKNPYFRPRMRFEYYNDPDNFKLVSDRYVKSPLKDYYITSPEIHEGMAFVVKDGGITQTIDGVPSMRTA